MQSVPVLLMMLKLKTQDFSEADDLAPVACAKTVPPSDQLDPQFPAPIPRPLMVEDKRFQRSRSQDHFRCQE